MSQTGDSDWLVRSSFRPDQRTEQHSGSGGLDGTLEMLMKMRFSSVLLFLALASVSRSAPTAQHQDYSGHWFLQAMSTKSCIAAPAMSLFQWMTVVMDVRTMDQKDIYEVNSTIKMSEFCKDHHRVTNISEGGDVNIQPQTYCSDCAIVGAGDNSMLILVSRRESVTMTEFRNFQIKASALNLTNPFLFNKDYDKTNCKDPDSDDPEFKKHKNKFTALLIAAFKCPR
ncbi:hypothetical protein NL108_006478 [Boleophthalmus pectinirostris]|nr:hypothetical protein NL108_006478 [Boleophthalmus pectinirostris]